MIESDVSDKFMMMAERAIRRRDALVKALERIIAMDRVTVFSIGNPTDGGDGPSARIAREALARHVGGKQQP